MLRNFLLATGTLVIVFLFFEIAYRYSWFEFYATEIVSLNSDSFDKKTKTTVLVLGDSFTASEHNYVGVLNDSLPDIRFINSGIPGVGMGELSLLAERRINEFHPDKLLLQIYVGNDLIDEEKPVNWNTITFGRNCYWSIANSFYCFRYLNYKLGQYKSGTNLAVESGPTKNSNAFSTEQFSAREKMLTLADPGYLDASINLSGEYEHKYEKLKANVDAIAALCREHKIELYIVVLPVSCQVNTEYRNNLMQLGAKFSTPYSADSTYPFFNRIVKDYNSENVQILNPLIAFRKSEAAGVPMFYANDIHLNREGQKQLAQFLIPIFNEAEH